MSSELESDRAMVMIFESFGDDGAGYDKKCNNISVEPKINVKKFPLTANVWLLKYGSLVAHSFKSF